MAHPCDSTQHETDAAEDDYSDQDETDLPRHQRNLLVLEVHVRDQGEQVREKNRDEVRPWPVIVRRRRLARTRGQHEIDQGL